MSSQPLAALAVQPQQPQDPLSEFARVLQIRGMQQQQQGQQTANQIGNIQLQQTQLAQQDDQKWRAALVSPSWDGTPEGLLNLGLKQGVGPESYKNMATGLAATQDQYAKLGSDQLKVASDLEDHIGSQYEAIQAAPPSQRLVAQQQAKQNSTAFINNTSGIPAPVKQQFLQGLSAIPDDVPMSDDELETRIALNKGAAGLAETALKKAQANEANANVAKIAGSMNPASSLYAPSEAAIAMGTAPGSTQIQAGRAAQAGQTAAAEAKARQPFELQLASARAQIEQAVKNGSAADAGRMLAAGLIAPSEVAARSNPSFLVQANQAALAVDPNYKAQQAEANFNVAKSEANTPFFGSANSLIAPGGTLDQLQTAAAKLKNTSLPLVNKVENFAAGQVGRPAIAAYNQTVLGAADDYAKVMGGGTASDSARNTLIQALSSDKSPKQIQAAIGAARAAVNSQIESRIGNNPALKNMYGSQLPNRNAAAAQFSVGQKVMIKGKPMTITAVHPDGTFDAQ
jgi:hypothetical protein